MWSLFDNQNMAWLPSALSVKTAAMFLSGTTNGRMA
jgi:hypothetical protein